MRKTATLSIFILAGLLPIRAAANEEYTTFRAVVCGIQFEYPRTWRARTLPRINRVLSRAQRENLQCVVVIDPPAWDEELKASEYEIEDHAIFLNVYREAFPETAVKGRFFLQDDGRWRILGRANDFPVPLATSCCFGLRGQMTYGRFRKDGTGGYQGLGTYDHAILSSIGKSVIASAPGGHTVVFDRVLLTLHMQ
jgi:hypothetical protein